MNKPSPLKNRGFVALAAGASLLIVGSFGVSALANNKTVQHLQLAASDTSITQMVEKVGWGERKHKRHMRFANMSDEEIEKRVTRMVRHAAIEIDATPEQEAKIITLATALAKSMKPLKADMMGAGKELHEILLKDSIDRAALEKLRAERLADIDRASKDLTNALADVAEILTPEQRATLDERIKEFKKYRRGGRGHGWGHGWRHG